MIKYCSFIFLFILLIPVPGKTQNIGAGAEAIYNPQTESFGAGARVSFFPRRILSIVPEFAYYFPFNKINEYYLGVALECKVAGRFAEGHPGTPGGLHRRPKG